MLKHQNRMEFSSALPLERVHPLTWGASCHMSSLLLQHKLVGFFYQAYSVDHDKMSQYAESDLGLHYLSVAFCWI